MLGVTHLVYIVFFVVCQRQQKMTTLFDLSYVIVMKI